MTVSVSRYLFRDRPERSLHLVVPFAAAETDRGGLGQALQVLLRFPLSVRRSVEAVDGGLGDVIDAWRAVNHWSPAQLADLAVRCTAGRLHVLTRELEDISLRKAIHPSPRLFKALAAIHLSVCERRAAAAAGVPVEPGDPVGFASPLTLDGSANRASWWFALYCQEDWARDTIDLPLDWRTPADLSSRLSALLRRQMVESGLDPIADGRGALRTVFGDNQATLNRLNLWLMGVREMDGEELHACMHRLLHVLRNSGSTLTSVRALLEAL